jgi:hypothetical protein
LRRWRRATRRPRSPREQRYARSPFNIELTGSATLPSRTGPFAITAAAGSGRFVGTAFGVGDAPESVAVGDVNGDGKPDLVVANEGTNTVSVLLGAGDGQFGLRHDFPRSVPSRLRWATSR